MKKQDRKDLKELLEKGDKRGCPGISRRDMLKVSGLAVAGMALPFNTACDTSEWSPDPEPRKLPLPNMPNGTSSVGIVKRDYAENLMNPDIKLSMAEEMVRSAIDMAGGLGDINQGDRVVIKPNLTAGFVPIIMNQRVNTSKFVLQAVIRAVKDRTAAKNITVGESSAFNLPTKMFAAEAGYVQIMNEEGVNGEAWENMEYEQVFSDHWNHIDFNLRIPKSLSTFDHFINVPILKNHDMVPDTNVDYTCCLKNHVGVIHPLNRLFGGEENFPELVEGIILPPMIHAGIHQATLGEISAELGLVVPNHTMNIVDALTIILTGGPAATNMDWCSPGLVIASKDMVACDSLAVAVLKHYAKVEGIATDVPYINKSVWDQAQIIRARQLNLGNGPDKIQVSQDGVDNFDEIMSEWV